MNVTGPLRLVALILLLSSLSLADDFQSEWPDNVQRTWIGPEYWANPLQDWQLSGGRLECVVGGPNRNVFLLTHELIDRAGDLNMSVRLGRMDDGQAKLDKGFVGFSLGVQGPLGEYRNNALHGRGLLAGINTRGELVLGPAKAKKPISSPGPASVLAQIELRLAAKPDGQRYQVVLSAHDPTDGKELDRVVQPIRPDQLVGGLALVSSRSAAAAKNKAARGGNVRFWFDDWRISGSKVAGHADRTFGPILFSQYTLSGGVLKITAQMPPVGQTDSQTVRLEIRAEGNDTWKPAGEASIDKLARTATIRVENWDASRDTPYRLVYHLAGNDHFWCGTIRRDPVDKETIVVAAFTGNQDYAFPNHVIAQNVAKQDPDLLFFSGDQIYEGNAGYGIQREPLEVACLDYLRKWYLFGWAFGDLIRDRPSISIPDDHDVYQGNIWGAGGRKVEQKDHDAGGYVMGPTWVNMVQRTQTSHLPDPCDPTPVEQGITVYYTAMNYGRISFAVIEDRKWKSGPKGLCPPTGGRPDHVTDPNFDPRTADVPGAVLLGRRQLRFLADWAADWRGSDFKVALSQTIFSGSCSLHGGNLMRLVADYDCNGWPQSGRNKALYELRRGFALHIAGDQHLASIIQQGIDQFNDAAWSLCVPSIAAGYPRVWQPLEPGKNRQPGFPDYTGEFLDGLGNRITVWAVANPQKEYRKGVIQRARDKASGYGIARFNKTTRDITLECWPLDIDPTADGAAQYPGWPKTINQLDNDGRQPVAYLPTIQVTGITDPVFQIVDEANIRVVYTIRIKGTKFRPPVYGKGKHTIHVSNPERGQKIILGDMPALPPDQTRTIEVTF
jgi:alkaline phosphatase D